MTVVVDASIALDWCFESGRTIQANDVLEHVLREGAIVPALWPAEVANGLLTASRRGRITPAKVAEATSMLRALSIAVVAQDRQVELVELLKVGERFGLTAYDSAYLWLAMREGRPLASNEGPLKAAAKQAGVPLFGAKRR